MWFHLCFFTLSFYPTIQGVYFICTLSCNASWTLELFLNLCSMKSKFNLVGHDTVVAPFENPFTVRTGIIRIAVLGVYATIPQRNLG